VSSARARLDDAYERFEALAYPQGIATALNDLGALDCDVGDFALARLRHEEALAIHTERGERGSVTFTLSLMARLALASGDMAWALRLSTRCLALARDVGRRREIAASLEVLGSVFAARDEAEQACRLLGAAEALREWMDHPISPPDLAWHASAVEAARAALTPELADTAWAIGRERPLDTIVAQALEGAERLAGRLG
jgi:hypothetical protein